MKSEGKTLEFKENTSSLSGIIKTIIAFANTSGGIIVIGVQDKTKKIIGIKNPLHEEERLVSTIYDSITPSLVPDIEVHTYRRKELIIIRVYHAAGPYYLKNSDPEKSVYIRFGSTNRIANAETLASLRDYASNVYFDEKPCLDGKLNLLDWDAIKNLFQQVQKKITGHTAESLGLVTKHGNGECPTFGGIILFGINRRLSFPDAIIRCARFLGNNRVNILDQIDLESYFPYAIDEALRNILNKQFEKLF